MKISIITVAYNSAATIGDTIRSVLEQKGCDIEYIIIDGGSKDRTVDIIKQYEGGISRWISEKDGGIYDAMNKGLRLATGDVIGFLNADDFYNASDILAQVSDLFSTTGCDGLYGDLVYVNATDTQEIVRRWRSGRMGKRSFLFGWMPPHPTFFVRKAVYEQYGGFNTQLRSAADYEIMLRFIHKHSIRMAYLPQTMVRMRVGGVSNSSLKNRARANREDRLAWKLNGLRPYFFTTMLKPIRKISQFLIK